MSRNVLHKNYLQDFLEYLSKNNYVVLPLKGEYEVGRVMDGNKKLHLIYHKNTKSVHLTITGERLEQEVRKFIRERKENRDLTKDKSP